MPEGKQEVGMKQGKWNGQLSCDGCGATFASISAEAEHRLNFPLLCREQRPAKATPEKSPL